VTDRPSRAGVITDMTGPLSFLGLVKANVARMVIDEVNTGAGLCGPREARPSPFVRLPHSPLRISS
jgi:branched-chain amino acid transport system substrate-binding protein